MRIRTVLGEILPVVGTIGLLGMWLYQQTEVEKRSGELRNLAAARAVFQTYQSNNALFNAINEEFSHNERASRQLRMYQVYNYELGLSAIEKVLSESEKEGIPEAPDAYDLQGDIEAKMATTQRRLEALQTKLDEREETISRGAAKSRVRFLWSYIALSLISILGAVCKTLDKLLAKPA